MPFEYTRRNQDGTLGKTKKFGKEETPEEKATRLEQENKLLLDSLMEVSSYMADQEHRITGQDNAIMELSTLVAMGLAGGESGV